MKKKLLFSFVLLIFSTAIFSQPTFNLGLKAGLNNSKITFNQSGFTSESIVKYHIGAFGRLGFNRIFVQPEVYFSAKGGDIDGNLIDIATRFDYGTVDIPLLLGIKVIDGNRGNFRIVGGPVFGLFTNQDIEPQDFFDAQFYKDNYVAFQYGVGADFLGFTLDLRMENTASNIYSHPGSNLEGMNKTFMVSFGYKIF